MPREVDLSDLTTAPASSPARTADQFSSVMDKTFGSGKWTLTGGYRTPEREDQLRAQGAGTVPAGQMSDHSLGSANAPGARDIVVAGMTPEQAAAKLKASGARFRHFIPEGTHGTQGAHLHIDTDMTPDPVDLSDLIAPPAQSAPPEKAAGYFGSILPGAKKEVGEQIGAIKAFGDEGREKLKHPLMSALKDTVGLALAPRKMAEGQAAKAAETVEGAVTAAKEHRLPQYAGELTGRAGVNIGEGLLTEGALRGAGALKGTVKGAESLAPKAKSMLDPKKSAAKRLQMAADLKKPEAKAAMAAKAAEQEGVGAGKATVLDVLPKRAVKMARKVAGESVKGAEVLEKHAEEKERGVSAQAAARTEELSPHKESIAERRETLKQKQDALAREQFREPYAQKFQADDHLLDILSEQSGSTAISRALRTAKERSLEFPESAEQAKELQSLQDYHRAKGKYQSDLAAWEAGPKGEFTSRPPPEAAKLMDDPNVSERLKDGIKKTYGWKETPKPEAPQPPEISAGALDRIRISMRDTAGQMAEKGARDIAGGIKSREKALDKYLDEVPHLGEARATYRDYAKRIEQLDFDENLADMKPESFKATLKDLSPEQRAERVKAVTDKLAEGLGRSASGVKSTEGVLTTGRNAQENLRELLGKETADKYLRAMDLIQRSTERAEYAAGADPAAQSKEFADEATKTGALAGALTILGHPHWAAYEVMRFIGKHVGRLNTEEEGRHIAEWVTQQEDVEKTLQEIGDAANPAKREKSKLPKDILDKIPPRAPVVAAGVAGGAYALPTETDDRQPDQP